ncbi:MAG TPA: translational GTPase TypA, partial [Deinococcales bacterium]|nr:translational GTPase TypA [Deinococcales bacterium]
RVIAEVPVAAVGAVMESLASRRGTLENMEQGENSARVEFTMPSRALFGYRNSFMSLTSGEGLLSHVFDSYRPRAGELRSRSEGSLVSMEDGTAFPYAMWRLQDRGVFFVQPGSEVYVGMVLGEHGRAGDLEINVTRNKKHTNVRASGSDDNIVLVPPRTLTLEEALAWVGDDELIEVTPESLRLRKRYLDPHVRKREAKTAA